MKALCCWRMFYTTLTFIWLKGSFFFIWNVFSWTFALFSISRTKGKKRFYLIKVTKIKFTRTYIIQHCFTLFKIWNHTLSTENRQFKQHCLWLFYCKRCKKCFSLLESTLPFNSLVNFFTFSDLSKVSIISVWGLYRNWHLRVGNAHCLQCSVHR